MVDKQPDLARCLIPDCDLLSSYWLWDADEPDEEYRVCPRHARLYVEHIGHCDESPCQFRIARVHEPQAVRG